MRISAAFLSLALLVCSPAQAGTADCLRGQSKSASCQNILRNYWQHEQLISEVALEVGLEPALLKALVAVESSFNPLARSPANALGLTQVIPPTAIGLGVKNPSTDLYQARISLKTGATYLRKMWFEFKDWKLALAAYNAGPGAVYKHKGIPPFRETQEYVPKVLSLYHEFSLAEKRATEY